MRAVIDYAQETSFGDRIRSLRLVLGLSQQKLSDSADVSPEEVALLERNLPVRLDVRRRVSRDLWLRKARQQIDEGRR
ncbi:hypothetical protein ACFLXH_05255 [Chloroflexota bacterium]